MRKTALSPVLGLTGRHLVPEEHAWAPSTPPDPMRARVGTFWTRVAALPASRMSAGFALVESCFRRIRITADNLSKSFIVFADASEYTLKGESL